ncbi:MAG: Holliday junction resolvase RuvX [Chloroflexi bacterium]|nr:MAG: Holliday junction resolvase RuvX [Chloroflexota bacterium]
MKRIMALDVGDRRIGVAVSDPLGVIARSLTVLQREGDETTIAQIRTLVDEHGVGRLIVGFPRLLSGEIGAQAQAVEDFARQLEAAVDIPVELWDERLSTVTAARVLTERGQSAREQKATIDAVAAAVILQDYLDARQARTSMPDKGTHE